MGPDQAMSNDTPLNTIRRLVREARARGDPADAGAIARAAEKIHGNIDKNVLMKTIAETMGKDGEATHPIS